jgi:hypothetical protein
MKLSKANLDFLDDLFEKLLEDEKQNGDASDSIDIASDSPSAESRDT